MEQFSLEKYLENPSRKVVTRDLREVEIYYNPNRRIPLIGRTSNNEIYQYNENGYQYEAMNQAKNDLFFADEEEELTEFEKKVLEISGKDYKYVPSIKVDAQILLDLARKEIEKSNPYIGKQKQGEQKPIEQDTETHDLWVYIREWNEKFGRLPKDEDELAACIDYVMKRQKPADKAEPSFKVGDWIVYEGLGTYKVVEIHEGWYSVIDSNDRRWSIMFESESLCHIWTINDAKDGDVLVAHECYVIFKEIDGLNIRCHCTYHYMGLNPSFYADTLQNKDAFYPATKEQHDLLFQKMKEAGYEWDAENKELNMISAQSSWSEDDEKMLISALWHVSNSESNGKSTDYQCEVTDWLKSIKDRVQPQPKQPVNTVLITEV